jgi:hypothetical protein
VVRFLPDALDLGMEYRTFGSLVGVSSASLDGRRWLVPSRGPFSGAEEDGLS